MAFCENCSMCSLELHVMSNRPEWSLREPVPILSMILVNTGEFVNHRLDVLMSRSSILFLIENTESGEHKEEWLLWALKLLN